MEPEQPLARSPASASHPVPDELHQWVSQLVEEVHIDPDAVDVEGLLDLAREVAHQVLRPAVPVTTFILGYALGSSGGDRAHLEVLVHQVHELTRAWGQRQGQGKS